MALWEGSAVVRYAPDGRVSRVVETPCSRPTSCCFGGADNATLFITSCSLDTTMNAAAAPLDHEPYAGAVFALRDAGVAGAPVHKAAF